MSTMTYIAVTPILHGRTEVPEGGQLQLTDDQAKRLGEAVKLLDRQPTEAPAEAGSAGQQ